MTESFSAMLSRVYGSMSHDQYMEAERAHAESTAAGSRYMSRLFGDAPQDIVAAK